MKPNFKASSKLILGMLFAFLLPILAACTGAANTAATAVPAAATAVTDAATAVATAVQKKERLRFKL